MPIGSIGLSIDFFHPSFSRIAVGKGTLGAKCTPGHDRNGANCFLLLRQGFYNLGEIMFGAGRIA